MSIEAIDVHRPQASPPGALKTVATIGIPGSAGSSFDHGAFDPKTRRIFLAHTGRDCVEVLDHDAGRHVATLPGFPEAAGIAADAGEVLVTNRGSASLAWIDAETMQTRAVFEVGERPNGVAIVTSKSLAIAACIGDDGRGATLHAIALGSSQHHRANLPGRPRWCVTDAASERVFLAIRDPSMVLVAKLPDLSGIEHWRIPSVGAHGLEIDHGRGRLYVACDDSTLVEIEIGSGQVSNTWPLVGPPDVTFVDPLSGLVHVAIGDPGLVQSIDPLTGRSVDTPTARGAHTTALVPPGRIYVFSPAHRGALVLASA
jgi:DNA-binding beta-propeller fold protein YncE